MKEQNLPSCYQHNDGGAPVAIGMKLETKEGEGTEFIIQLRIN
jgi:hypothetical protein